MRPRNSGSCSNAAWTRSKAPVPVSCRTSLRIATDTRGITRTASLCFRVRRGGALTRGGEAPDAFRVARGHERAYGCWQNCDAIRGDPSGVGEARDGVGVVTGPHDVLDADFFAERLVAES